MSSDASNEIIANGTWKNTSILEDIKQPPTTPVTAATQAALWWSSEHCPYNPVGPYKDRQLLLDDKAEFLQVQRRFHLFMEWASPTSVW
jgi:hypothetical protein